MLLCKICNDSKWSTSQEADGVHLRCRSFRLERYEPGAKPPSEAFYLRQSDDEELMLVRCNYTMILPHYTGVVPTARY